MSAKLALRHIRRPHRPPTLSIRQWSTAHSRLRFVPRPISTGTRACTLKLRRLHGRVDSIVIKHRSLFTDAIPPILVPPTVFVGLLLALWTWKCMMMVLFQDKIIYMPSMPPFARSEKIEDYAAQCKPVEWTEQHIKSLDGTKIALCVGTIPQDKIQSEFKAKNVIICYFQGNGSSLPPRLPILSNVLKALTARSTSEGVPVRYTVVGLSYRGYWTSSGRASQSGIELDAQALLHHVATTYTDKDTEIILWGQSIGSGIATTAAAKYILNSRPDSPKIKALALEMPFTSVKSMLVALYPQKWLPYRYLSPFLWNRWDSEEALRSIASSKDTPKVLLLPATRDEVVPSEEIDKLEDLCKELKLDVTRTDVVGALHNEASTRRDGQQAVAKFISDVHK